MAQHATARADLEALLRARRLDRTVTTGDEAPRFEPVPTGWAALDQQAGGGLPRGEMSEIVGPRSSGRATVVVSALAAVTRAGGLAALIDPLDQFDPPSAAAAGVCLDRLLWVRGEGEPRLERGVKALNLVLQAGGFDLAVLEMGDVPYEDIKRLPFTTWFRLQRTMAGSRTACVVTGPGPVARSAGGSSVQLQARHRAMPGGRLLGLGIEARVLRPRQADAGRCRMNGDVVWG
ncbi:MAG TPA: hypothetical protein VK911_00540 [Vicinamibacterales bacterium]|nr:hypothetical protein [Vicinamibacterales bacterium]